MISGEAGGVMIFPENGAGAAKTCLLCSCTCHGNRCRGEDEKCSKARHGKDV